MLNNFRRVSRVKVERRTNKKFLFDFNVFEQISWRALVRIHPLVSKRFPSAKIDMHDFGHCARDT